jgi:hypothetical protein
MERQWGYWGVERTDSEKKRMIKGGGRGWEGWNTARVIEKKEARVRVLFILERERERTWLDFRTIYGG